MTTKSQSIQPIGCVAFAITAFIIMGIVKCLSGDLAPNDTKDNSIPRIVVVKQKYQPSHKTKDYEMVATTKGTDGLIKNMMVYLRNAKDIERVNRVLIDGYKSDNNKEFQIYYFDSKKIAANYERILFDPGTTEAQSNRISRHVIGKYVYSKFTYTDSLYTGTHADEN